MVPEDPYAGLADTAAPPETGSRSIWWTRASPSTEALVARAAAAEEAALAVAGITNSEGAEAGFGRAEAYLVTSAGFAGQQGPHQPLDLRQRARRHRHRNAARLRLPFHRPSGRPGRSGGDRPQRRRTGGRAAQPGAAADRQSCPCVYDPRVAGGLLGHLAGAINGASVARGTTFLKDRLGARIFPEGIKIHDDPRRVRGLRSRAFDGEGTPTAARDLIEDGVLTTWLLDSRSARQLGLRSTGHASRGTSGPPSPGADQPVSRRRQADAQPN